MSMWSGLYQQLKSAMTATTPVDSLRAERGLLIALVIGVTLIPLNTTMIAVALPQITDALRLSNTTSGWLVTLHLIVMASLPPVAGKLGDRLGKRWIILGAIGWLGIASLGAATAPNATILLFFRMQQAIAGAMALPNGMALVREVVPAERRAARFGLLGAAMAVGAASGPPLGGLLVALAGWRAIFYVNLPLVLLTLSVGWRFIPNGQQRRTTQPFDILGALLLCGVLASTAALVMRLRTMPLVLFLGGATLIALVGIFFVWREARHPDPVLQPRLFRNRSFAAANMIFGLTDTITYPILLIIPALLTAVGWSVLQIGLALITISVATMICAPIGGTLADRFGRRRPTTFGLALMLCGVLALWPSLNQIILPLLLLGLALIGAGLGFAVAAIQAVAVESVAPEQVGMASGVLSMSRFLGSIIGSSITISLIGTAQTDASGFGIMLGLMAVTASLAILLSFRLYDHPPARLAEEASSPAQS